MSKMSELSMLMDEIITTGSSLIQQLAAVQNLLASTDKEADAPEKQTGPASGTEDPSYTLETVRELLAKKSNLDNGRHRTKVKELVKKYSGGGTLKDVPAEKYAELVKEAEVIGNA